MWACLPPTVAAETSAEVAVKAAVVHKIAKFVTWPDSAFSSADSPIRFCVVGNGGIFEALMTTVMGLIVAIPSLYVFGIFRNKVDAVVSDTTASAETLVEPLKKLDR